MLPAWRLVVLLCAGWSCAVLGALQARAKSYGHRELFAPAAGSGRRGIVYAFGKGMAPGAKESVREHLPTWFAGVLYHAGILAGLVFLVLLLIGAVPGGVLRRVVQALLLAGSLCGAFLAARRALTPHLRALSVPDDYVSNLLVTAFLALALARTLTPAVEPVFLGETALLFLWVPLGKIRHCLFFFTTRFHMANHFGRRGVFPPRDVAGTPGGVRSDA